MSYENSGGNCGATERSRAKYIDGKYSVKFENQQFYDNIMDMWQASLHCLLLNYFH